MDNNKETIPEFIQQQQAFTKMMRDSASTFLDSKVEEKRIGVYRELFYNNIEDILASAFPVLNKIMPATTWQALVKDYFSRHKSKTPIFHEIPQEFLQYLQQEHDGICNFPFLQELAHYEWVELALDLDTTDLSSIAVERDGNLLTEHPIVSPLAWLLQYHYPVHQISPDFLPEKPSEVPTYLVVYRRYNDEVHFMEVNPVSAWLLELVRDDSKITGEIALQRICKELQHPEPNIVISGGKQALQEFYEQDIILGSAIDI